MRRVSTFLMFLTAASILAPALATAQSSTATVTGATSVHRGFGVGTAGLFWPNGLNDSSRWVPNLLATWGDQNGRFHIDGLFGFLHQTTSNFDLGVRGWYHVHAAPSADLSLGGGLALLSTKAPNADRQTHFVLELGANVRTFIVSNVALIGSMGIGIFLPDQGDSTLLISGNLVGSLGAVYYFQ
jgi:hypothetical protein